MKYYIKNVKAWSIINTWDNRCNDKAVEYFKNYINEKLKANLPDNIISDFYFGIHRFCIKLSAEMDKMDYISISPNLGSINKLIDEYNNSEEYKPFIVKLIRNSSILKEHMVNFEIKLISKENNKYVVNNYEIFVQGIRCRQSPKNAKSYISILNKNNEKYKSDHQIKMLNNYNSNVLEFDTFYDVVGNTNDEINLKLSEIHNDFINILKEVLKNKKGYFYSRAFTISIYDMFEQYLNEFGWRKLSHPTNKYVRDDYTYKFDVRICKDDENVYRLCVKMKSRIRKSYTYTVGCSAYIDFSCLYK